MDPASSVCGFVCPWWQDKISRRRQETCYHFLGATKGSHLIPSVKWTISPPWGRAASTSFTESLNEGWFNSHPDSTPSPQDVILIVEPGRHSLVLLGVIINYKSRVVIKMGTRKKGLLVRNWHLIVASKNSVASKKEKNFAWNIPVHGHPLHTTGAFLRYKLLSGDK